jgi:hypothetical protein
MGWRVIDDDDDDDYDNGRTGKQSIGKDLKESVGNPMEVLSRHMPEENHEQSQ